MGASFFDTTPSASTMSTATAHGRARSACRADVVASDPHQKSLRMARVRGRLAARTSACHHLLATRAHGRHRRRRHRRPLPGERCCSHRFPDGSITPWPAYTLVPVGWGQRCRPQWQRHYCPIQRNRRALRHPPRCPRLRPRLLLCCRRCRRDRRRRRRRRSRRRRHRRCSHAPRRRPCRPSLSWPASGQQGLRPPPLPPPRPPTVTRRLCLLWRRRCQWRRASRGGGRLLSNSGSSQWRPERRPSGGWRTPQP